MRNKNKFILLSVLFIGLFFGAFFSSAPSSYALPSMSPDGKTCTPCHEEGGPEGAAVHSAEQPAQQPAEQPAQPTVPEKSAEPAGGDSVETSASSASPWLIVGGIVVILAAVYLLAMRKKDK